MFDVRPERGNGALECVGDRVFQIVPFRSQREEIWRGELLQASGIVGVSLGVAELRPPPSTIPSILLPKTSQIILDNVVLLDKGSASVNAPLPLHRKITSAIDYQ